MKWYFITCMHECFLSLSFFFKISLSHILFFLSCFLTLTSYICPLSRSHILIALYSLTLLLLILTFSLTLYCSIFYFWTNYSKSDMRTVMSEMFHNRENLRQQIPIFFFHSADYLNNLAHDFKDIYWEKSKVPCISKIARGDQTYAFVWWYLVRKMFLHQLKEVCEYLLGMEKAFGHNKTDAFIVQLFEEKLYLNYTYWHKDCLSLLHDLENMIPAQQEYEMAESVDGECVEFLQKVSDNWKYCICFHY
jgi:hypothetical protein